MFNFLKKKKNKPKSCLGCKYYDENHISCKVTSYDNIISFPFKNTNCKLFKKK